MLKIAAGVTHNRQSLIEKLAENAVAIFDCHKEGAISQCQTDGCDVTNLVFYLA